MFPLVGLLELWDCTNCTWKGRKKGNEDKTDWDGHGRILHAYTYTAWLLYLLVKIGVCIYHIQHTHAYIYSLSLCVSPPPPHRPLFYSLNKSIAARGIINMHFAIVTQSHTPFFRTRQRRTATNSSRSPTPALVIGVTRDYTLLYGKCSLCVFRMLKVTSIACRFSKGGTRGGHCSNGRAVERISLEYNKGLRLHLIDRFLKRVGFVIELSVAYQLVVNSW